LGKERVNVIEKFCAALDVLLAHMFSQAAWKDLCRTWIESSSSCGVENVTNHTARLLPRRRQKLGFELMRPASYDSTKAATCAARSRLAELD
jgi:hypothetical protein